MQLGRSELVKTLEIGVFALSFFLLLAVQSSPAPSKRLPEKSLLTDPWSGILVQP